MKKPFYSPFTRRHDGAPTPNPLQENPKPMTANPGAKVVNALKSLTAEIDSAADELIADAHNQSKRTKDGFHLLKAHVTKPWADANDMIEGYMNELSNGGPPLEE